MPIPVVFNVTPPGGDPRALPEMDESLERLSAAASRHEEQGTFHVERDGTVDFVYRGNPMWSHLVVRALESAGWEIVSERSSRTPDAAHECDHFAESRLPLPHAEAAVATG